MGKKMDLVGKKYGRLTVVELAGHTKRHERIWRCVCECGGEHNVRASHLNNGSVKSCGCLRREIATTRNWKHGLTKHRLHVIWAGMLQRCNDKNYVNYHCYGGRGIRVCSEWQEDFMAFWEWANANGYEDNLTLDRIDVNGDYEPSNCRWATVQEQSYNRQDTKYLEYNGVRKSLAQWSRECGINSLTVRRRYKKFGPDCPEEILKPTRRKTNVNNKL